jgi:DNA-binding XRE family transcriptional regulator
MNAVREQCLHERLRQARKAIGLTQKELEEASGIPQNTISRIELGKNPWLTDKTYQARSMSYVYIGPMEGRRVHPDACHRASMVPQALSSLRRNHGEHTLSV